MHCENFLRIIKMHLRTKWKIRNYSGIDVDQSKLGMRRHNMTATNRARLTPTHFRKMEASYCIGTNLYANSLGAPECKGVNRGCRPCPAGDAMTIPHEFRRSNHFNLNGPAEALAGIGRVHRRAYRKTANPNRVSQFWPARRQEAQSPLEPIPVLSQVRVRLSKGTPKAPELLVNAPGPSVRVESWVFVVRSFESTSANKRACDRRSAQVPSPLHNIRTPNEERTSDQFRVPTTSLT